MARTEKKATTIYLESRLAKAIKVKAALTGKSLSDMVNEALSDKLRQDEEDLRIIRERRKEPTRSYEEFLNELKRDGLI